VAKVVTDQGAQRQAAADPRKDPNKLVHVWPHLVGMELIAVLVFSLGLVLMSVFIKAPLVELANPELTPNPAKAPWYFLNLQELLLHMHPTLAGVIVPGVVLLLLAAIPYIDNTPAGTGVYFSTPKGRRIALFSTIYTTVWLLFLILFDEYVGVTELFKALQLPGFIGEVVVPLVVMIGMYVLLAVILRRVWQADTREVMIGMFMIFIVSYVILTIVGTAFRGPGMELMWPWEINQQAPH